MNKSVFIQAFTIVEAVVSMVVTAIILAIVFVIFSITSQRLIDFKKQNDQTADLTRLSYSINKAIFENEIMTLTNGNELIFKDYSGRETGYIIYKKYFVRKREEFIDTFNLSTKQVYIDMLPSKSGTCQYQRLKWELMVDEKPVNLCFYKKIYANELFKLAVKDEF